MSDVREGPPRGLCIAVAVLAILLVAQLAMGVDDGEGRTGAAAARPSPASSGHARIARTPGQTAGAAPRASKDPFVGPVPTTDTATWFLVPDACLIAALELVDRAPETALTGAQAAYLLQVMEEGTESSQAVAAADAQMVGTAQGILTRAQLAQIDAHAAEIQGGTLDVDALCDALGSPGDAPPAPGGPEQPLPPAPLYSAPHMLAGIQYLADTGGLFRGQAARLRPLVTCVVERRRARTDIYRKATAPLTQPQMARLVGFLAEMRAGQRAHEPPSPDFVARLAERARTP